MAMKIVKLSPRADREVKNHSQYYESRRHGYGTVFRQALRKCLRLIAQHPNLGTKVDEVFRRRRVLSFPFIIYYCEYDSYVWISTIFHSSRDQESWGNVLDELPSA